MKQVIRKVKDKKGKIQVVDIPTPNLGDDQVLISTHYSLISSGTETTTIGKTPVELAKQTIQDPWMRNIVKNLVFSGGIRQTLDVVKNEVDLYRAIGYSGSGIVLKTGKNVSDVKVGDRVAYAAQGHAEQVAAYANHVVKVDEDVNLKHAAFATVGGIALQGVRRAQTHIGDWVVVYGLGLVGQLTAQILDASGAKVIGIDIDKTRIALAKKTAIQHIVNPSEEEVVNAVLRKTSGKGADATIICASSKDPAIANNAMKMTRKQGRVVFVGLVKMDLERMPFFLNELDLSFSRAYGPGSYDNAYEKGRVDYPYHYVRWTEKRNLVEIIRLIKEGRLNIDPLIEGVVSISDAQRAFDKIRSKKMDSVAMLLSYPHVNEVKTIIQTGHLKSNKVLKKNKIGVGVIGVGNFARNFLLPNLERTKRYNIRALCSASGINATSVSDQYRAEYVTSDYHDILKDPEIDAVLIATRHNLHSKIVIDAAKAGKNIFVEKPIAMNLSDLDSVKKAVEKSGVHLMVGFNRRYSDVSKSVKKRITQKPIIVRYTVNIQHLPESHWTLDPIEGGGRLVGESDHFFDLMNYFIGSPPVKVQAHALPLTGDSQEGLFNTMVQVKYENGSIGQLTYTSLGGPNLPREKVEIFCGSHHVEIRDFREILVDGKKNSKKSGMGYREELIAFYDQLTGKNENAIPNLDETFWADWIILTADDQVRKNKG
ncbi:MAG: bi-domain-containing oxidoreductase [Candidatus Altiarchaeota archaeon]